MVNYKLKSHILEVVENQLKMDDPKCTKETFNRLIRLGYSEAESKEMIGKVLIVEIFDILKNKYVFNEKRYAKSLSLLPDYAE
jgi:Holliday junction resolvasome RuvABC DNA-binding subunit